MKPICVNCQRFYHPKRNGVTFIESMPNGDAAMPGKESPECWTPYKVWLGDLWECPNCNSQIIVGVAQYPISEHYEDNFDEALKQATITVNDC